jgi:hypothetical protein
MKRGTLKEYYSILLKSTVQHTIHKSLLFNLTNIHLVLHDIQYGELKCCISSSPLQSVQQLVFACIWPTHRHAYHSTL